MINGKKFFGFSQNVFILSLVSFLNDIGGETIKRTIPLFLTNVLGAKTGVVGLVEGIGEATPQIFQPISGWLSDKTKKRKPFIVGGQILRSTMIFLFLVKSWPVVLLLRFLDRSGKGITGASRDALLSLSSEKKARGRSFGLNRALDHAGAVIGLVFAGLIILLAQKQMLSLERQTFAKIVLLAVIPLFLAIFLVTFLVREKKSEEVRKISLSSQFPKTFYYFLSLSFLFALGNSSDGFLVLRAQNLKIVLWQIFFLLAGLSFLASLVSLPAGILSDRLGRKKILVGGWILYSLIYFGFAQNASHFWMVFLFLFYGVYYGLTEGVAKALVSDLVPKETQGTAFGFYNLVTGLTLFPASLIAGFLWQSISPALPFYFGGILAALAAFGLIFLKI